MQHAITMVFILILNFILADFTLAEEKLPKPTKQVEKSSTFFCLEGF